MSGRLRLAGALAVLAAAAVAALLLWPTSVPGGLHPPQLSAPRVFGAHAVRSASAFEAFVRWDDLLSELALLATLAVYVRIGPRFTRESAAGPIGTGFLLGMLGLAIVWLVRLPFGIAELWWARRHHVLHVGYVELVFGGWLGLAGKFAFLCLALLIAMGFARLLRRSWWLPAAACFAGLFALFAFVAPYLGGLHRPRSAALRTQAAAIARAEGVAGVPLRVQKVRDWTPQPNAYAFGLGPSRRVVLWDTIVGFPRREVRVVIAHEYGHLAHHHIADELAWFAILMLPAGLAVALLTRGRGGLARPEAVPLTLLVVAGLQLVATPLQATISRRHEAEADWAALQTTRDPRAMEALMRRFTSRALADPDPPGWFHVLFDDHPSGLERVEMARAWAARNVRLGTVPAWQPRPSRRRPRRSTTPTSTRAGRRATGARPSWTSRRTASTGTSA